MKTLKSLMWKTFYRFKHGANFNSEYVKSKMLGLYLYEQNNQKVGIGRNYNALGEQVRGWHRRRYHSSHPLIKKYCD